MSSASHYSLRPIAIAHTPFAEKFAIPRQPSLAPSVQGELELLPPYDDARAVAGLEQVSHIWLTFVFHQTLTNHDKPHLQVRPPRLGGNEKLGVFASRATHRPNNLGLSVVELLEVRPGRLLVGGLDLLDGTPIVDIRPYVPYADHITTAKNDIAAAPPPLIRVDFSPTAEQQAQQHGARLAQPLQQVITQCLAQDPKPAYQNPTPEREYGVQLWDLNVVWHYPSPERICVLRLEPVSNE
ncbi:tRNA (N6-threonylcarbamoyladenosine(37)-N6)-methyltransferase TrmO [Bacterioplanes sanyensis]|uniref:tRNA (N6-threonylcarbamoyladenosine(37)-N6)-methyltransferase TrmO n=1 Tax=Bacterioplanes sanyensis TaxID=1249553 RepID=A0A222FJD0_9GAMM|nr:tRNA (N6-threonylcarbamoyladenosine(37)-N6)-methyltransferase TrmO [Bacterioplanes sanyensis]ASP39155.1 tRNA (N6-threonylcarbamoyladenosine(37)-N6)-methyltransferase TrmO [Bacterioplanes sanyensis]